MSYLKLAAIVASFLTICLPLTALAEIGTRDTTTGGLAIITSSLRVDDFSKVIPSCASMTFTMSPGKDSVVSLYSTASADDTLSEIEAALLIDVFSSVDKTHGPFTPDTDQIRFVVDTRTSGTAGTLEWTCSNYTANSTREQLLVSVKVESSSGWDNLTYTAGENCLAWAEGLESDGTTTCTTNSYNSWGWTKDVTITSLGLAMEGTSAVNATSCEISISNDIGQTQMPGLVVQGPDADADGAPGAGKVYRVSGFSSTVAAGTQLYLQPKTGDFCNSGTCGCTAGQFQGNFEVWGYFN